MGLSRKRKQQLAHITAHAAKSHKSRKIDRGNQRRTRFLRKQREEKDFWDEHEDPQSESSSGESNSDEPSLGERSSNEENVEADDGRGDNTKERLGDNDGEVQLEVEDHTFRPVGKEMQVGIYEECEGVVLQPQKNVRENVKESWKNRLLQQSQL